MNLAKFLLLSVVACVALLAVFLRVSPSATSAASGPLSLKEMINVRGGDCTCPGCDLLPQYGCNQPDECIVCKHSAGQGNNPANCPDQGKYYSGENWNDSQTTDPQNGKISSNLVAIFCYNLHKCTTSGMTQQMSQCTPCGT